MLWTITAAEDLTFGDFVEFIADVDGKLSCKNASKPEAIKAVVTRDIVKSETLSFDTEGDTPDLVGRKGPFYRK